MRRLLLATLALMLLFTPGCRKDTGDADAPVALTFWHIMNYEGPREALADAVARFEKENPGVTVRMETFKNDPYKEQLSREMASGTPPDVFFTWGGGHLADLAKAGKVLDLTPWMDEDVRRERFLPEPVRICSAEGSVYAVPLDLAAVPIWYNRLLFAAHDLQPPKTYADLLEVSAAFRKRGITPVALGNMDQWPGAFLFIYLATREGGAQRFFDAAARTGDASFADPAYVRAGERLRELVEADVFSKGFNGINEDQARTQFFSSDAAMYVMGTWTVSHAKKQEDFLSRMGCIPFPTVADGKGDPGTMVGGVNCAFGVSATCEQPDLAKKLLDHLTSELTAKHWCAAGRIPALAVDDETLALLPEPTRAAYDLLTAAPTLQPYYDQYLSPRLAEEHKKTTQGLFAGTLTPQEAADRMEQAAQALAADAAP